MGDASEEKIYPPAFGMPTSPDGRGVRLGHGQNLTATSDQMYYGKPPCRHDEIEFHNGRDCKGCQFVPGTVCTKKCTTDADCPANKHPWKYDIKPRCEKLGLMEQKYGGRHCFNMGTDQGPNECPDGMITGTKDEPDYPSGGPCLWPPTPTEAAPSKDDDEAEDASEEKIYPPAFGMPTSPDGRGVQLSDNFTAALMV